MEVVNEDSPRRALVNAFAFGGLNVCMAFAA